jgi:hypothetical protein
LPLGQGKRWLNGSNPVVKRIVGGWQVNWLATYQSMDPLSFSGAERIAASKNNPHTLERWFDVKQFVVQEPFTLRQLSARVADLRAPGVKKWDLTAVKSIPLTEKVRMRIQAEFYNAWNTPHFGPPNTTVTSADFGMITGYNTDICDACTLIPPRQIQLGARITW